MDAKDIIRFDSSGQLDIKATQKNASRLSGWKGYVIPGFYGALPDEKITDKSIKTFPRDGTDISGAIIGIVVGVKIYEKWTRDVPCVCMADPKIVPEAQKISVMTFQDLGEMSYSGAKVLHPNVAPLLQNLGIKIRVRNPEHPNDEGTLIVPGDEAPDREPGFVVGIAGRKDFTIFTLYKALMINELGFGRRMLGVFENLKISIENPPGGINTLSVVAKSEALVGKVDLVTAALKRECSPDRMTIVSDMALVCIVGYKLKKSLIFNALDAENIENKMAGESDISIIVSVDNRDYERATRAIYDALVK